MIVVDQQNPRARGLWSELSARLPDGYDAGDLVVVVGGDGFMLATVAQLGLERTYLGLNAGHLGFLLNDVSSEPDEAARQLETGSYTEVAFPLLRGSIRLVDGTTVMRRAINDIYLERSTGHAARFALAIDGHDVIEGLLADGLVFATALGSTAYNYSAGGSPSHPRLRAIHVTPICPHRPKLTPFVLPATAVARLEVLQHQRRPARAVVDGREVGLAVGLEVRQSERAVRLAYLEGHDFTYQMLRKIVHP